MSVRKWYIDQALSSYVALGRVINDLTEEEVLACLALEAGTQRRRSFVNRLIARAVKLRTIDLTRQMKEKFHATS